MRPILIGAVLLILPTITYAQSATSWCEGILPGCDNGVQDFLPALFNTAIDKIMGTPGQWGYLPILGLLFLLIGASYLILNVGDEQRVETGKKTIIWTIAGLAIALFAQEFVWYLTSESFADTGFIFSGGIGSINEDGLTGILFAFIRIVQTFLNLMLFIAILYNGYRLVLSQGDEGQFGKAKTGLFWAAIGALTFNVSMRLLDAVFGFFV